MLRGSLLIFVFDSCEGCYGLQEFGKGRGSKGGYWFDKEWFGFIEVQYLDLCFFINLEGF